MAQITKIWLATVTKNVDDSGTDEGRLNVTINIDGSDVLDRDFGYLHGSGILSSGLGPDSGWLTEGQAALVDAALDPPIETALLTNSSVRLGIRGDDAWGPHNVLVLGKTDRRVIPLAMETGIPGSLSTDSSEGKLTIPIRLVSEGTSSTIIRRLLLLIYTGSGSSTDSQIQLQITAGGNLVAQGTIADTPQDDLEEYTANWYELPVGAPFTRGDVLSNGEVRLNILGADRWAPSQLFVYGLDTASGRPDAVVHLVSIPEWTLGAMSTDPQEGMASVQLPVV